VLDLLDDLQDALEDLVRGAVGVVGADEEDHGFEFNVEVEFAVLDPPEDVFDPEVSRLEDASRAWGCTCRRRCRS
jgi:hypothetical protein